MRVERPHASRHRIGLLHLSEDLRFADNHRIEARGYAKEMPHRIAMTILIEVLLHRARLDLKVLANESTQIGGSVFRPRQQLHTVAGGNDHRLLDSSVTRQALGGFPAGALLRAG